MKLSPSLWVSLLAVSLLLFSYLWRGENLPTESPSAHDGVRVATSGDAENPPGQGSPSATSSATSILLDVPFAAQAPTGNWADIRQQDGCEEAVSLMAVRWAEGKMLTPLEAEREITAVSDYELERYGHFHETSIQDTAERILSGYFRFRNYEVRNGIGIEDIKAELVNGNAVIVAVNGQKLLNPFYTPPGPLDHMVVVRGYDAETKQFIVNDPGTKFGEKFLISDHVLTQALRDYPSGSHEPVEEIMTAMIVVRPLP